MLTLQSKESTRVEGTGNFNQMYLKVLFGFLFVMRGLCNLDFIEPQAALAEMESSSAVTSRILEVPSPDEEVKLTFTLYTINNVQYFSAGVGVEERNASYPPYPLKMIFVQGERAFLADVAISIAKSDGTSLADIPSEHVMGPWLFVELPPGTYTITATDSRQRIIKKEVRVGEGGPRVVHFRWPE